MMKHKIIYDPVFRSEVLFYSCKNFKEVVAHAKLKHKVDISDSNVDGNMGMCWEQIDDETKITFWVIWIRDKKDWKTMVHEAAHVVFRILDARGVKYNSGNDETWCYLHEFFIAKFWHEML